MLAQQQRPSESAALFRSQSPGTERMGSGRLCLSSSTGQPVDKVRGSL